MSKSLPTFDFCVLGGGPAGLAFATLAARSGARVLLVERFGYEAPRPGEHLPGGVRGALAALGVPMPQEPGVIRQSAAIISRWGSEVPEVKSYAARPDGAALNVDRSAFDAMIFAHAVSEGVVAHLGAKLSSAERKGGAWTVTLEDQAEHHCLRADWIVDATGRNAVFARRKGSRLNMAGDLIGVSTWYDLEGEYDAPSAALVIDAAATSWWSLAQTPSGRAVTCCYTSRSLLQSRNTRPQEWAGSALVDVPQIANRLMAAGALAVASRAFACAPALSAPPFGDRWIAIGDAAAGYDPVCGHGSQYALETAFRAFELFSSQDVLAKVGPIYAEALEKKVQNHLKRRTEIYLEADIFEPRFLNAAVLAGLTSRGE